MYAFRTVSGQKQDGDSDLVDIALTCVVSFPSYPGSVCDLVGPRYGAAFLLLTTVPCVVATAAISTPLGFIIVRLFIGFVLATFVTTQVRHV